MKSHLCGLGIGFGLGFMGGLLLMNNCRPARQKVAEAQDAITQKMSDIHDTMKEKMENKKRGADKESAAVTTGKNTPNAEL